MLRNTLVAASVALVAMSAAAVAKTVNWTNPANGSSFAVGTEVKPMGAASGSSTGVGLDLMLALDSSGSMGGTIDTDGDGIRDTSLREYQQTAAISLINSLIAGGGSAGVVDFDSNAFVAQSLVPLGVPANVTALETAIRGIDASGGTDIRDGINASATELGTNGTAGRNQQIVVFSDGQQSGTTPETAAAAALANGYVVNTVGLPGTDVAKLQAIATAGGGTFVDATTDLTALNNLVSGAGGNFVGVSSLDITDPSGAMYSVTADAFGNFMVNPYNLMLGANTWTVLATFDDNSTQSATLTLNGVDNTTVVPIPGAVFFYLAGLAALGFARRARA